MGRKRVFVVWTLFLLLRLGSGLANLGLSQQRDACCGNYSVPSDPRQLFPIFSLNLSDVTTDVTCFHRVCAGASTTFRLQYSGQSAPEVSVLADLCDVISSHGWSEARSPGDMLPLTGRCLCLAVKVKAMAEERPDQGSMTLKLGVTSWENQGLFNSTSIGYSCQVTEETEVVKSHEEPASSVTGWRVGLGVTLALLLLMLLAAVLYHVCWTKRQTLPNCSDLKIGERLASCLSRVRRRVNPEGATQPRRPRNLRSLPISGPLPVIGLLGPHEMLHPPGQPDPSGQPDPREYENGAIDNAAFSSDQGTASENDSCVVEASLSNGVSNRTPPPAPPRPRLQLPLQAVEVSRKGESEREGEGGSEGVGTTPRGKRRFLPLPPLGLLKALKKATSRPTSELQREQEQDIEQEHSRNWRERRDVSNTAETPTPGQQGAEAIPHHDFMYDEPNGYPEYDDDDDFYDSEFDDVDGETDA